MTSNTTATLGVALLLATVLDASAQGLGDTRSRFADLVQARAYPAAAADVGPVSLRWNLADRRQVLYTFEQSELETTSQRLDGAARSFERESEADGTLIVHSRGGGLSSEVRIEDVTMRTVVRAGAGPQSATARLPVLIAGGLQETGRLAAEKEAPPTSVENLVTGLFALPEAALRPGQSQDVPVRFGAAVQWGRTRESMTTYPVVIEGTARITRAGTERLETCRCVRLDIDFDLSNATPPPDFPARIDVVIRGRARTWFDPRAARMAEGELAMVLGIDLASPDQPRNAGLTIVTDTHTRVRIGR